MGIDIASWRSYIGSFQLRSISTYDSSNITNSAKTIKDIKGSPYRYPLLPFVLLILASLTICMDIEPNPGPASIATLEQPSTAAYSSHQSPSTLFQYTGLFNATKRIQLKLTRYQHHLLNYTFFKENNCIPSSLYPCFPPLYTDNVKFYRRWRYISHSAAYRHLKLLITECKRKIKTLTKELSQHLELLRNSCSTDAFSFYQAKLDSMALSLESLLAERRAKKTAPIRRFINHNLTDNSINPQVNSNDTPSNVTHNASNLTHSPTVTPTRRRSRRKTKPANIQLDHSSVINISNCSLSTDETSILSRGLTFCPTPRHIKWPEVSADIYDFSRRMRLTEYFFDDNSRTSNSTEPESPFHNSSTWNPPNDRERALNTFLDAVKLDITTSKPKTIRDNLTATERQAIRQLRQRQDIIIKPADKGSGTVVMDKTWYIDECNRQLSDTKFYRRLNEDITADIQNRVTFYVNRMYRRQTY